MTRKCPPGEVYNIGGEVTLSIKEMLDLLISFSLAKDRIQVRQDPGLIRPSDVTLQVPDTTKFRKATGWKPEIPFEKTLQDTLKYWREKAKHITVSKDEIERLKKLA